MITRRLSLMAFLDVHMTLRDAHNGTHVLQLVSAATEAYATTFETWLLPLVVARMGISSADEHKWMK